LLAAHEYAVAHEFLQMPDEHALSDLRNTAPQFTGAHGALREAPEDGAFPAAVDDRKHGVDGAWGAFFFRYGHGLIFSQANLRSN